VLFLADDLEAKKAQSLDHPALRGVNREFADHSQTVASATNASRIGGSSSRTSLPKVSM